NPVGAGNVRAKEEGPRWTTAARSRTIAVLLDAIEGGRELRHLRSGSQAATRARPGLAERRRFVGARLEPSLTLRKTGRRNRLSFQLQEGHPRTAAGSRAAVVPGPSLPGPGFRSPLMEATSIPSAPEPRTSAPPGLRPAAAGARMGQDAPAQV